MSTKIKTPNGGVISNASIESVTPTKTGVVCLNSQQKIVHWMEVKDPDKKKKVLDILSDFSMAGDSAVQPDWSFLQESDAEVK